MATPRCALAQRGNFCLTVQEYRVGQAFLAGFTEGGEEFIEALIQTALQKATYDPDARFSLENG